jgi:pyruvate dehydrogenase E2 component (dihydrolipoamide acetyltransferase)
MPEQICAVTMPKWGIEMTEGTINHWATREGEHVQKGATLLEVETEKIVNTVEAPASGTLRRIIANAGEVRPVGSLIAVLADAAVSEAEVTSFIARFEGASVSFEPDSERSSQGQVGGDPAPAAAAAAEQKMREAAAAASTEVRVSPVARRLAEQLGIDLKQVQPAGNNARITKEDVEAYAARRQSGAVAEPAPDDNPITRVPLSATRLTIARRMSAATQTIPHYRVTVEIDAGPLRAHRRALAARGGKPSLNDMVLRACALALVRHPALNAQLAGEEVLQYAHADIAFAVSTDTGLLTPIVRAADQKNLAELASETAALAQKARNNTLTREEITGGTFSISNLGMYGVAQFDAIINPPQVAILAVGAVRPAVLVRNGAAVVGELLTLTLSADHRVIDGAQAAEFMRTVSDLTGTPERL